MASTKNYLSILTQSMMIFCILSTVNSGKIGGSAPGTRSNLGGPDGTVPAAYPPNDGSGGYLASTGQGRGSPGRAAGPVAGVGLTALELDGVDDYALVRDFKGLPTSVISAGAWISVTHHKSYNRILSHEWVSWGWNLYTDGGGVAHFGIGQNNVDYAASKIIFRYRWHYLVGTYDGEVIRIYVDGVPGVRTTLKGAVLDGDGYLSMGGAEWDPFFGRIDDVRLWNYALTQQEVVMGMMVQPEGVEPGLVGYWRFDEGQGLTARDMTSYGNHANLGPQRRSPRWIQSGAQVHIPCVSAGNAVTVTLPGLMEEEGQATAYLVSLPEIGSLYQPTVQQDFIKIESVPIELTVSSRRLLYEAPAEVDAPICAQFEYRVHNGRFTSREPATVLLEVVPDAAMCLERTLDTEHGCWAVRTLKTYALALTRPPRVSIIVPLYNQGELLGETLESVEAQTFQDFEVVIMDDGSTDDSLHVARRLVEAYNKKGFSMRVLTKSNGGLADTRNAAFRAARSDWVLPLDSDDIIQPSFLEQAVALIDADNTTNLVIADLQGFGAWEYSWRLPEYDALDLLYSNMFHCSALFHRSLWQAVPGGYPPTTLFGYE
ncbi:hypothetical protein CYMTET_3613, partial [Cymbomonas tetramitiformis]